MSETLKEKSETPYYYNPDSSEFKAVLVQVIQYWDSNQPYTSTETGNELILPSNTIICLIATPGSGKNTLRKRLIKLLGFGSAQQQELATSAKSLSAFEIYQKVLMTHNIPYQIDDQYPFRLFEEMAMQNYLQKGHAIINHNGWRKTTTWNELRQFAQ